jgi:hypothetical protein
MKRVLLITLLSVFITGVYAQNSIDALFRKYGDADGFVTINLKGGFLKLARAFSDDKGNCDFKGEINEIRMLVQEDKTFRSDNFYQSIIKDINLRDYDEFLRIKEKDQDLRMLVRAEGDRFREFLLIGGGEDNMIIQIKGDLTLRDAEALSADLRDRHGRRRLVADND